MKFSNSETLNNTLTEVIKAGVGIEIWNDSEDGIYIDLCTGMKSHAYLFIGEDSCTLKGRYNEETVLHFEEEWEGQFYDLFYGFIANCKCYQDFANSGWWTLLEKKGIDLNKY